MNPRRSRPRNQSRFPPLIPCKPNDFDFDVGADRRADGLPTHDARGIPYPPVRRTDLPADIVLPRLRSVSGGGPTWSACCPAHADDKPSLSVTETADAVLLIKCHASCTAKAVMAAIGLDQSFLYPSPYALRFGDRQGRLRSGPASGRGGRVAQVPIADYARFAEIARATQAPPRRLRELGRRLGLPPTSLAALGVGYDAVKGCWVFPEYDAMRRVVGVIYRDPDGQKKCEVGSRRGLTIPADLDQLREGPLYLPEGATDTAAFHSVGAAAVGRPAAGASRFVHHWLATLLRPFGDRPLVVVGDRDAEKKGKCPGRDGARELAFHLADVLRRPVRWALPSPPFNDVRDQVVAGHWNQGLFYTEEFNA